ncbi:MAG TPA: D-aminoacyl-tRNA deacylase [Vicinamibacterales bacterium]|nr:D-aminoacyl-tRNA deacylase [Vicinamibacterales bacterium]
MRAVVQRVARARVTVGDRVTGEIGHGLLVFVGVEKEDAAADVEYIVSKVRDLRVFDDDGDAEGRTRMNRSVRDVRGDALVVSQFTLAGDVRRGRRPSFDAAAAPDLARDLYERVVEQLRAAGITVATGEFQAMMRVELVNDGPVTILIDSRRRF